MAAETIDICAEFPFTRVSVRRAVSSPAGSPSVRTREINERELRIFNVVGDGVPRQKIDRIKDQWTRVGLGPSQALNFTPDDESQIEVVMNSFSYQVDGATTGSFQLELEEVR